MTPTSMAWRGRAIGNAKRVRPGLKALIAPRRKSLGKRIEATWVAPSAESQAFSTEPDAGDWLTWPPFFYNPRSVPIASCIHQCSARCHREGLTLLSYPLRLAQCKCCRPCCGNTSNVTGADLDHR